MSSLEPLRRQLARHPRLAAPVRALYRRGWRALSAHRERTVLALFESLGRRLAEDPLVDVPEFGGVFRLDVRSALFRRVIAADGAYEPKLTALCRAHLDPSRDALDVGANVGFHAVLFGRLVASDRRVLAIEPTAAAAARLATNLTANGVAERVLVHRGAVADRAGEMTIKTIAGREEFSTLGEMAHPAVAGQTWHEERVGVDTLDALVARHGLDPGFVKVDVEGAEHLVFGGADRLLSEHRPVILTELSDALLRANGSSARAVIELLAAHDYALEDPSHPGAGSAGRDFGELLCVPR